MALKNKIKKVALKSLILLTGVLAGLGIYKGSEYVNTINQNNNINTNNIKCLTEIVSDLAEKVYPTIIVKNTDTTSINSILFKCLFPEQNNINNIKNDYSNQQAIVYSFSTKNFVEKACNGIIIAEDGLLLTNHHLVSDFNETYLRMPSDSEKKLIKLELIAYNENSDLALLKIINEEDRAKDDELIQDFKKKYGIKNITLSSSDSDLVLKYFQISLDNFNKENSQDKIDYSIKETKIKKVKIVSDQILTTNKEKLSIYTKDFLTSENVLKKGMSGSPLYDSFGNLTGLAFFSDDKKTMSCYIPSKVIYSFLKECRYGMEK
jgi:hypothetical protein